MKRRLGEPQSQLWRRENLLSLLGIEPQFLSHSTYNLVTIPTELSHLLAYIYKRDHDT
jgi:hypothetical protein